MKKKIYTVILCMMMVLSLVGCSKSQKPNDTNILMLVMMKF